MLSPMERLVNRSRPAIVQIWQRLGDRAVNGVHARLALQRGTGSSGDQGPGSILRLLTANPGSSAEGRRGAEIQPGRARFLPSVGGNEHKNSPGQHEPNRAAFECVGFISAGDTTDQREARPPGPDRRDHSAPGAPLYPRCLQRCCSERVFFFVPSGGRSQEQLPWGLLRSNPGCATQPSIASGN